MSNFIKMKILTIILIFFSSLFFSQNIKEIDSIAQNWCKEIENSTNKFSSEEILKNSFIMVVLPYVEKFDNNIKDEIFSKIYYRIQRLGCKRFYELNNDIEPESGSMKRLTKMPESTISNYYIKLFKNNNNFKYKENNGSITKVILSKSSWLSHFSDGTFSEYSLRWINENEFEIVYVNSNNEARRNMNIVGNKYYYRIIDFNKLEQKFILVEYVPNVSKFAEFDLNLDRKN